MSIFSNKACLVTAVVTVLTAGSAHADNEDVIAKCARIASTGDRILCLENALRGLSSGSEPAASARSGEITEQESQPAEIVSESVPSTVGKPTETHASADADISVDERSDVNVTVSSTTSVTADSLPVNTRESPSAEPGPREIVIDKFGAVDKETVDEKPAAIDVRVVSVSNDPYGKLIFTTEGGQIWYQTDKRSVRYREIPFDASIRTAAAGSFMLRPLSGGVSIRVKRRK